MKKRLLETEEPFEMSSKVMVYGRPFYSKYDNEIHISAQAVYPEKGEDRSYEIEFKQMMEMYRVKYFKETAG